MSSRIARAVATPVVALALTLGTLSGPLTAVTFAAPPVGASTHEVTEQDEQDLELLSRLVVITFASATPSVRPFGTTTLTWSVKLPSGSRSSAITFWINGGPVAPSGTRAFPVSPTGTYSLVAHLGRVQRNLASLVVRVDTSACQSVVIPDALIDGTVKNLLANLPEEYRSRLSNASTRVTIHPDGIYLHLSGQISIDDWPDPDLTVDMVLGVSAVNGQLVLSEQSFSDDVSFPWWANLLPPVVSSIVNHFISDGIEDGIRGALPSYVIQSAEALSGSLFGQSKVWTASTGEGQLNLTLCAVPTTTVLSTTTTTFAAR